MTTTTTTAARTRTTRKNNTNSKNNTNIKNQPPRQEGSSGRRTDLPQLEDVVQWEFTLEVQQQPAVAEQPISIAVVRTSLCSRIQTGMLDMSDYASM
jgi:hypothetical protein